MRGGLSLALALLLLAPLVLPPAEAAHDRRTPRDLESAKAAPKAEPSSAAVAPPASKKKTTPSGGDGPLESVAKGLGGVPTPVGLAVAGLAGLAVLGLAVLVAKRAFHPPPPKPPRKSFAAGRAKGVRDGIRGAQAALAALARSDLGEVAGAAPEGSGYRVVLKRGRGVPCEHAAGYLTGLFEAAWALDVRLEHPSCGGKTKGAPCVYEAYPAPPAVPRRAAPAPATSSGRGGAAASTRG